MTGADALILIGKLNLAAAAAILIVFAVRPLIRRGAGARLTYALWLLPLIAMAACLIPPRQVVVQAAAGAGALPAPTGPIVDMWAALPAAAEQTVPRLDPVALTLALWILGVVIAAFFMARLQRRFTAEARRGGIGPAVVGLVSPRIVTPRDFAERFDPEEQALVLAHEQAHIRRQDSRLNGLAAAIQCLCWFNPLIHLAIRHMRVDQELACDETVVTRFPDARSAYARALVKTQLANRPLPLGCYWPSGTQHPLLERIAMLKTADIGAARRLAGASCLALLCAASAAAAWAANPAKVIYQPAAVAAEPGFVAVEQPAGAGFVPVGTPTGPAPRAEPVRTLERTVGAHRANGAPGGTPERIEIAQAAPPSQIAPTGQNPSQAAADAAAASVGGKVTFVGDGKIPPYTAFVRYFDGSSPLLVKGRVTEVRMPAGERAELMVAGEDGRTYRVIGGSHDNFNAAQNAEAAAIGGQTVVVRGYLAHDKTCVGGCLMDGRSVTYPDGRNVITMPPTAQAAASPTR